MDRAALLWPLLLLVLCLAGGATGQDQYILPRDVIPHHYDLKLVYDVDPSTNFSYYGVVDILVTCKKSSAKIVLHGQGFSVNKEKAIVKGPSSSLPVEAVKIDDTYNFLTLSLGAELTADQNYTLTIPFYGNLKNDLDGVYISSYLNKMKETHIQEYLIATQFEAISARKGFPCFDEPILKATFSVNIGHHRDFSAVSNMPQFNSSQENALEDIWSWQEISKTFKKERSAFIWDQFATSVPMSTYLLAFVVSKFGYVESPAGLSTTKFRIWARRDALSQTSYASTVGPRVLTTFEKWFDVAFPLPKQDMIAIPDFSAGAMENWGLITYRETALLYDKEQSSSMAKERVAEVIAHELAHQWFGNLVTMKWWSDLWLNEGFATFVASLGVREVEPTWSSEMVSAVGNMRSVLNLDALETSHPVSVPINDPKRIQEIFDEISYKKGATLIRMMTMFLGEDVFRKAITKYLTKHSYRNAEQDDLWWELTRVSQMYNVLSRNVTVKEIMDTWTKQTGYPLLTVARDYADKSLTVTQKRYLSLGAKSKTSVSWWVPLNVLCEHEVGKQRAEPIQWLSDSEGTTEEFKFDHDAENDQWVLFNADMIALYRVNYDQRNWDLLISTLNSDRYSSIPTLSRLQLLEDSFALAWSNVIDYSTALQLVNYLGRETEYLPIETGLAALGKIETVLIRTPEYGALQKFVRKLITKTYESAGGLFEKTIINGEDLNNVKMQVLTSRWACRMKVPGCEDNAVSLFKEWMEVDNPDVENPIPLDLRSIVYCVAISRGSVEEWRFLFQRYQNSNVAAAKTMAMMALACTREVWILQQYLDWCVSDGPEVRRQDAGAVISSIAYSSVGFYLARDFLYTRLEQIFNAFYGQGRRLGYIIKSVVEQFTTQHELDEFIAWSEKNMKYLQEARLAVSQAIEKSQVNIGWLNRNRKLVIDKMREYSQ